MHLENLESRRLLSTSLNLAGELIVQGSWGNDSLWVSQSGGTLTVSDNGWISYHNTSQVGRVILRGDWGNDNLSANGVSVPVTAEGSWGDDNITGGIGDDQLRGGPGNDVIRGYGAPLPTFSFSLNTGFTSRSAYFLYIPPADNDALYGDEGSDVLIGGNGADVMYGGTGVDVADYSERTTAVSVSLDGFANDGSIDAWGYPAEFDNVYGDVENVRGGLANDTLRGNANANALFGGAGNDTFFGGAGDDRIDGEGGNDWMYAEDGNDVLRGGDGPDVLFGQAGNDALYGGADNDHFSGGDGNDLLVSVGGGQGDYLQGEGGVDSFWMDAEPTEIIQSLDSAEAVRGNLHRIAGYMPTTVINNGATSTEAVSRDLNGQALQDPAVFAVSDGTQSVMPTYMSFSRTPLFSAAGPGRDDILQGQLGDCYLLAALSATAKANANRIRQSVVDLGDGTFGVQFFRNGVATHVRVDGDLPTVNGSACYGRVANGSLWGPVMEKAYAFFRRGDGHYASIAGGDAGETFASLGVSAGMGFRSPFQTGSDFLRGLQQELNLGRAVTLATPPAVIGRDLVSLHVYTVDRVVFDASGIATGVVLRNPWGTDGNGTPSDGVNDGFVTVSAHDIFWTWVTMHTAVV